MKWQTWPLLFCPYFYFIIYVLILVCLRKVLCLWHLACSFPYKTINNLNFLPSCLFFSPHLTQSSFAKSFEIPFLDPFFTFSYIRIYSIHTYVYIYIQYIYSIYMNWFIIILFMFHLALVSGQFPWHSLLWLKISHKLSLLPKHVQACVNTASEAAGVLVKY